MRKTFRIYAVSRITENIEAETREEALAIFDMKFPRYRADSVGEDTLIGYCENTSRPIFEGDDYEEDSDGIIWLKS